MSVVPRLGNNRFLYVTSYLVRWDTLGLIKFDLEIVGEKK